jgi:hypothetical protein
MLYKAVAKVSLWSACVPIHADEDLHEKVKVDVCLQLTPCRKDFCQSHSWRYCKRTLEQAASGWTRNQEGGVFPEDGLEVWTTATALVKG